MQPITLTINSNPHQLLQPLPDEIHSCSITILPMPIPAPTHQALQIRSWLTELKSRLTCTYIMYNNTLIPASDLTS